MKPKVVDYRPMTDLEVKGCRALARCTFLPGTPHKRFARDMGATAENMAEPAISAAQARQLWRLVWRYRRQIGEKGLVIHAQAMCLLYGDKIPGSAEVGRTS